MNKVAYIRIPKTGSTTLNHILSNNGFDGHYRGNQNQIILEALGCIQNKIIPKSAIYQSTFYKELETSLGIQKYYTATFVRNPFDRAVSAWKFLFNHPHRRDSEIKQQYTNLDFKEFIKILYKKQRLSLRDTWHTLPQYPLLLDNNNNLSIDFIGRFENFETDLNKLLNILEIKIDRIPHQMKTDHKFYREYYDKETQDMVSEIYEQDIKQFNYTF